MSDFGSLIEHVRKVTKETNQDNPTNGDRPVSLSSNGSHDLELASQTAEDYEIEQSSVPHQVAETSLTQLIPLKSIERNPDNPRLEFDQDFIEDLADSIKRDGLLQPIVVCRHPKKTKKYMLVMGEQRYLASKKAGLKEIECKVRLYDIREAQRLALVENLKRKNLNLVEETLGIIKHAAYELECEEEDVLRLVGRFSGVRNRGGSLDAYELEQEQILLKLLQDFGFKTFDSFRKGRMAILKLPDELLIAVNRRTLDATKGLELAKIKDDGLRIELMEEAIAQELTTDELKARIKEEVAASADRPTEAEKPYTEISHRLKTFSSALRKKGKKIKPGILKRLGTQLEKLEKLLEDDANYL